MVERLATGIAELDSLLSGGFPIPSNVLIKGAPGSFKTILCLQAIHSMAKKGTPCLYLTFNQPIDGIKEQAKQFGWNFEGLPAEFVSFDTTRDADVEAEIIKTVKDAKAKLVVMDSLTSFLSRPPISSASYQTDPMIEAIKKFPGLKISEDALIRAMTARLIRRMSQPGAVILFIYEDQSLEGIRAACEYIVDGVLKLGRVESIGRRTLTIEKMRYTPHDFLPRNMALKSKGIALE